MHDLVDDLNKCYTPPACFLNVPLYDTKMIFAVTVGVSRLLTGNLRSTWADVITVRNEE